MILKGKLGGKRRAGKGSFTPKKGGSGRIGNHYFLFPCSLGAPMFVPLSSSNCALPVKKSTSILADTNGRSIPKDALSLQSAEGVGRSLDNKENCAVRASQGMKPLESSSSFSFTKPPKRDEFASSKRAFVDQPSITKPAVLYVILVRMTCRNSMYHINAAKSYQSLIKNATRVLTVGIAGDLYAALCCV